MTPTQYDLLRKTVEHVRPIKTEIGWAQFNKMAEHVPKTELDDGARWRVTVGLLEMMLTQDVSSRLMVPITNSDSMDTLPGLTNVTKGYIELGIEAQHIPAMKGVFLWSMKKYLGSNFDSDMEEAWVLAFHLVEGALQAIASEAAASASPQDHD